MLKHKYYFRDKAPVPYKNIIKLKVLKIIRTNKIKQKSIRQHLMLSVFKKNQFFNFNKMKKYCIISGRLRFVIYKQKFSRIIFKEFSSQRSYNRSF